MSSRAAQEDEDPLYRTASMRGTDRPPAESAARSGPSALDRFAEGAKRAIDRAKDVVVDTFFADVDRDTGARTGLLVRRAPPLELEAIEASPPDPPTAGPAQHESLPSHPPPPTFVPTQLHDPPPPRPLYPPTTVQGFAEEATSAPALAGMVSKPPRPSSTPAATETASPTFVTRDTTDEEKQILWLTGMARGVCINAFILVLMALVSLFLVAHMTVQKIKLSD